VPRGQCDGSLRPYSRFSRQEPLLFYQVAPQLYSRGWVDPKMKHPTSVNADPLGILAFLESWSRKLQVYLNSKSNPILKTLRTHSLNLYSRIHAYPHGQSKQYTDWHCKDQNSDNKSDKKFILTICCLHSSMHSYHSTRDMEAKQHWTVLALDKFKLFCYCSKESSG
jgi:hypothetical protein